MQLRHAAFAESRSSPSPAATGNAVSPDPAKVSETPDFQVGEGDRSFRSGDRSSHRHSAEPNDEVSPEPWSWPEWSADAAAGEIYSSKLTPMIGSRAIEVGARSEST